MLEDAAEPEDPPVPDELELDELELPELEEVELVDETVDELEVPEFEAFDLPLEVELEELLVAGAVAVLPVATVEPAEVELAEVDPAAEVAAPVAVGAVLAVVPPAAEAV